ncbi:MAG TPA: T9SS type A sorting domain-containing protein [Flavobacterium sp.]
MKKTLLFAALLTASLTQSQVTVGSGSGIDSNAGLSTPVSNYYGYSLSQTIYLASELNAAGNITALQFQLNSSEPITNSDDMVDVWIGHTTRSSYAPALSATGADWIPISAQAHVLTNGSLTRIGNTVTMTLAQPFVYNGTDNLVITVDANEPEFDSGTILYLQGAASANIMSLMFRNDTPANNPDPANPPLNYTGSFPATSVQAKTTRPVITFAGLTPLGVDTHATAKNISIYPNPVESALYISSGTVVLSAELYSVTGRRIGTAAIDNGSVATGDLAPGAYFVTLTLEGGSVSTLRFLKK